MRNQSIVVLTMALLLSLGMATQAVAEPTPQRVTRPEVKADPSHPMPQSVKKTRPGLSPDRSATKAPVDPKLINDAPYIDGSATKSPDDPKLINDAPYIKGVNISPYADNTPWLKVTFHYGSRPPSHPNTHPDGQMIAKDGDTAPCVVVKAEPGYREYKCAVDKDSPYFETKIRLTAKHEDGDRKVEIIYRFRTSLPVVMPTWGDPKSYNLGRQVSIYANIFRQYEVHDVTDASNVNPPKIAKGTTCMGSRLRLVSRNADSDDPWDTVFWTQLEGTNKCNTEYLVNRDEDTDSWQLTFVGLNNQETTSQELQLPWTGEDTQKVNDAAVIFKVADVVGNPETKCGTGLIQHVVPMEGKWAHDEMGVLTFGMQYWAPLGQGFDLQEVLVPAITHANVIFTAQHVQISSDDCTTEDQGGGRYSIKSRKIANAELFYAKDGYRYEDMPDPYHFSPIMRCNFTAKVDPGFTEDENGQGVGLEIHKMVEWMCPSFY